MLGASRWSPQVDSGAGCTRARRPPVRTRPNWRPPDELARRPAGQSSLSQAAASIAASLQHLENLAMLKHLKQRREQPEVEPLACPQAAAGQASQLEQQAKQAGQPRRVRGRRSSKPAMEKRRRARMNQSLDELKFYVLNDQNNLRRLGIDAGSIENMDEETVARTMLKSSGLIHRHRGRKNPNKLEKADILELTVDYVRMLLNQANQVRPSNAPLSLSLPLTDQARLSLQAVPPSPPSSSQSTPTPQPLLAISANSQPAGSAPADTCCHALDLRSSKKLSTSPAQNAWTGFSQQPQQLAADHH